MHLVIVGCEKASSKKSVDCSIVHYWKNTSFHMASRRAVGRSENPGVPVLFGGHNLPPCLREG